MKIFYTIFLSLFCFSVFSQNWNVINKDYEYHYAVNDEYNTTIKIDSFEVNFGDTTFFLNRIVTPCDSCIIAGSDEYLKYNQPTFLQRQVLKQGTDFIFSDTTTFLIKSNENLNSTWVFDAVNSISAEIIEVNQETIFGILDSVKTILLTGNDTIKVSKSFGIIQFKNQKVTGVKAGVDIFGFDILHFKDFFEFNVGDMFQHEEEVIVYGFPQSAEYFVYKTEIISKTLYNDSIVYSVNIKTRKAVFNAYQDQYHPDEYYYSFYDSDKKIVFKNDNKLFDSYKNQLIESEFSNLYFISQMETSPNLIDSKGYKVAISNNLPSLYTIHNSSLIMKASSNYVHQYEEVVKLSLGMTYTEGRFFESSNKKELIGYIRNGVQTGEVWEDIAFTNIKDLLNETSVSVFPNPSSEFILINSEIPEQNIKISILNNLGETIFSQSYSNQKAMEIDVKDFTEGVYFLKLENEGSVYQQKVMIR